MHALYLLSVWAHVMAAMAWVGGMIFVVAVVVPMLRRSELRELATELLVVTGARFRLLAWSALAVLGATGVINVLHRGYSLVQILSGDAFHGAWGRTLAHKLSLVAVVLVVSAVHDFWIGPAALNDPDPARRDKLRKRASMLGRVNFAMALAVVALAVALVRG